LNGTMPTSSKVLEDSLRLARIRRIKMVLYTIQAIMMVVLALFFIIIMGGAQINPVLYVPVDSFAAVMVLLLLVIALEGFFFRMIELRFARSSSARHLMAKNSIKQSLIIAVIAAVVAAMLMVPVVLSAIEDASEKTVALVRGTDVSFWSRDPLALQRASEVRVTADSIVEVYLVSAQVYVDHRSSLSDLFLLRQNRDDYVVPMNEELVIPVPMTDHTQFYLVLNDIRSQGTVATAVIVMDISEMFTGIVALLTLAIMVANLAWVAYLIPIERKYSVGSIYK
jgi:hypothetical protein